MKLKIKQLSAVHLRVTLVNDTEEDVEIDIQNTPFEYEAHEGLSNDFLEILSPKKRRVSYMGRLCKRISNPNWVVIKPKKKISGILNLSTGYKLYPGTFVIRCKLLLFTKSADFINVKSKIIGFEVPPIKVK